MVERLGPIQSLARSFELTAGHRWGVFWLISMIAVISAIGDRLLEAFAVDLFGAVLGAIVAIAWLILTLAFCAITVAVTYHDLRVEKEGGDIEQIAKLFA